MTNPNIQNSPEPASPQTLASIIKGAEAILNVFGVKKPNLHGSSLGVVSATMPIENPTLVPTMPDTHPDININKPIGDFAKNARWGYEISYGTQGAGLSRHILVLNGEQPLGEIGFYDGTKERQLSEDEAQKIAQDLASIATKE